MYITNKTKKYPCTGYHPSPTGIDVRFPGVEGVTLPLTGSIMLVSEDDNRILAIQDCADYARQTFENGVLTLTNEPEPIAPTAAELLELARSAAYERIKGKCNASIESGVTVNGKHYRLNELDQMSLNAAVALANSGAVEVPFAADGEALTMYSVETIKAVGNAAYKWGIANKLYYAILPMWIKREKNITVLEGINYGSALPENYMSALTAQLTAAGIDAAVMSGLIIA